MFSTDRNILVDGAEARARMAWYGTIFDELHIILLTRGTRSKFLSPSSNVFIYPTNSKSRWQCLWDGYRIASRVLRAQKTTAGWVMTAQDPFEVGLLAYLLRIRFRLPLQLQIHVDFLSPYFARESLKNKMRVFLGKWSAKRADGIRLVSGRIEKSLTERYPALAERITVLPIFVDISKAKNEEPRLNLHKTYPAHDFIIIMASRLTREKNIAIAIDAMQKIVRQFPKTLLLIVGSGPEKEHLTSQIERYQLQSNIVFTEWTHNLTSYYKTADLFLLTSNYEGYGRTVVEAAAAGCPVVMTDVGLAGEWIINEESGFVVGVGDAGKLVEVIAWLIARPEERRRVAQNAISAVSGLPSREEYLARYRVALASLFI